MNMMEQIWKIRDSRGLDTYEKNFLMVVASRGEAGCFCEWKRNSEDMGMKKDAYYNRRNSLRDKGLINVQERKDASTVYTINDAALIEWQATHSATQNDDSVSQNDLSATQNDRSVRPEGKKNIKKNKKSNLKKNIDSSVVPPSSLTEDKNEEDKEDQDNAPASPIVPNVPVPIVVNTPAHSVTQNELTDDERRKLHFGDPRWLPPVEKPKVLEEELAW